MRIYVGALGGDTTDLIARITAPALAETFRQRFIIENYPGANGTLASARAAKAKPDGHTLLFASSSFSANASLYSKLGHHPLRDFAPVARVAVVHNVLVVQASMRVTTVRGFIAAARENPGRIVFASAGTGSSSHLAAELLKVSAGPLNTLHVPYKGNGPAIADLLGGHVQAMFMTVPYASPHVGSGRVRALAVASSKRAAALPEVPTFEESGVRGVEASVWNAFLAPAGTPYDTIVRLGLATAGAAAEKRVRERLAAVGAEPVSDTPEQFASHLQMEVEKWAKVVKAASIALE